MGITKPSRVFFLVLWNSLRMLVALIFPYIAAIIIDEVTAKRYDSAMYYATLFLTIGLFYVFVRHLSGNAYTIYSNDLRNRLRAKYLKQVTKYDESYTEEIPHAFITSSAYGDIASVSLFGSTFIELFLSIISFVIAAIILIIANPACGVLVMGLIFLTLASLSYNIKRRDAYNHKLSTTQDSIANAMGQIIEGNKEIQAFNIQKAIKSHIAKYKKQWNEEFDNKVFYHNNSFSLTPYILDFGKVTLYIILTIMVVKQQLPVATLVLVIGYVTNIISEFMTFSEKMSDFSSYSTAVDRVYKVVSYRSNHIAKFGEYDHDSINGKIELRNVSFSYDKKHRILKNIDVIVPPHSLTAIVGRSGSGKSTIFRLLTRLYKTKSGKILLDDVNIYEYKPKVYATNVSMITQSPFVFNMSIRENLALINPDHAAQVAACKKAGIHDFIVNLRDGYNTKLNGNSKLISDSKKQLIALARALLTKSEVLLFDEVTAATDAKTAEKITKIMEELKKDHTVLFITHDPTLMRKADRILVVDDGVIVAQGTHKALIKRSKFYRDLQNR